MRVNLFPQTGRGVVFATVLILLCSLGVAQTAPVAGPRFADRGPADAPVTIVVYSDFECPYSKQMAPVIKDLARAYPTQVRILFKNRPLNIHPGSPLAHEAAMAAGEQGKFWPMADLLFANQQRHNENDLEGDAQLLNLDMAKFRQAMAEHKYKAMVEADGDEADHYGVQSTPMLFINGRKVSGVHPYKEIAAVVDQEIASATGQTAKAPGTLGGPIIRVKDVPVGDSPSRGAKNAVVTIVEFSDMQCPFCAKSAPVLQELVRQYPGKVRWVFKHHPLAFHPDAALAHKAVLAADGQGKFWEMHDAIFADQKNMKRDGLLAKAAKLGLNMKRFEADLDSHKFDSELKADELAGAQFDITGTPTFFINGRRQEGILALPAFKQLLETEIALATGEASSKLAAAQQVAVPSFGPKNAQVTLAWYDDLGNPFSRQAAEQIEQLRKIYQDKLRVEFHHDPRPNSELAHEALIAAGEQNRFWEMVPRLAGRGATLKRNDLLVIAEQLKLNPRAVAEALDRRTFRPVVEQDIARAKGLDVRGTPVFFVNGKRLDGLQPLAVLDVMVRGELDQAGSGSSVKSQTGK